MTHDEVESHLACDIADAYERAAAKHLDLFRQELAQFNLKRHTLVVKPYHGQLCLWINFALWFELGRGKPVLEAIYRIGNRIDDNAATWAPYLVGEPLWV